MAVQFDSLRPLMPTGSTAGTAAVSADAGAPDFGGTLTKLLGAVDATAADANVKVENMLTHGTDVHEAMIALHKAETTFQLTVQMRNKLMAAYSDIMRMPV